MRRGTQRPVRGCAALLLLAAPVLAACDSGAPDTGEGITVVDPWVRAAIRPVGSDALDSPPVNSAGYLVLRNPGQEPEALLGVETPIADTAEIHTVAMDDGVMRMRSADSVAVPAGGRAVLEPGGTHVMLVGIRSALAEGDTVPLTLRLRSGETLEVRAPVRRGPGG